MADSETYEVEHILGRRIVDGVIQYLIRWKGFNSDWDTWEPIENLLDCVQLLKNFENAISKQSPAKKKSEEVQAQKYAMEIINQSLQGLSSDDDSPKKKSPKSAQSSPPHYMNLHVKALFPKSTSKSPPKSAIEDCAMFTTKTTDKTVEGDQKSTEKKSPVKRKIEGTDSSKQPSVKKKKIEKENKKGSSGSFSPLSSNSKKVKCDEKIKKDSKKTSTEKKKRDSLTSTSSTSPKSPKSKVTKTSKTGKMKPLKIKIPGSKIDKLKMKNSTKDGKVIRKDTRKVDTLNIKSTKTAKKQSVQIAKKVLNKSKAQANKKSKKCMDEGENSEITVPKLVKQKMQSSLKSCEKGDSAEKKKDKKVKNIKKNSVAVDQKPKNFELKIKMKPGSKTSSHVAKKRLSDSKIKEHSKTKKKSEKKKNNNDNVELIDADDLSDLDSEGEGFLCIDKKLKAEIAVKRVQDGSLSDNGGLKVKNSAEVSPKRKIRLIDSVKSSKINPVSRSVSPTPLFTTVKPLTTSLIKAASSESISMESLCGDVPTYQYFPAVIPISPSSMSYRMFLENLPQQLHPKQNNKNKRVDDSPPEEVERRISVRQSECAFRYKDIVVKKCSKYTQIWMNTHTTVKNVLNPQVIQEIVSALNSAKYDDSNLVMFSGLGNVFCNGTDLHHLTKGDKRVAARQMVDALRDFTKALITFPKPIVAVVTGPAVGLGMTMLPLCDVVYASDKATFHLPYAQLCQTPEGCATFTLPSTVGMAMANELLIAGRRITAIEACSLGLVSQVFWPTSMMQEVIPRVQNMALLSGKSLETTKLLIRSHQRTKLELTNESESNLLLERWPSFETQKAIESYLNNEKNFTM